MTKPLGFKIGMSGLVISLIAVGIGMTRHQRRASARPGEMTSDVVEISMPPRYSDAEEYVLEELPFEESPSTARIEVSYPAEEVVPSVNLASAEILNALLPSWMLDRGNLFHEQRTVQGHSINRSRGRYEWPNGSSMEVEITDAGSDADEVTMMSLGFNINQTNKVDASGYTWAEDTDGVFVNQEYDFEDHSGSCQAILGERYMVEVKLQNLPPESFLQILEHQISFEQLYRIMEESIHD